MGRLTLEEIKNAKTKFKLEEREVEMESLGGSLLLRELLTGAMSDLQDRLTAMKKKDAPALDFNAEVLVAVCVDPPMDVEVAREFLTNMPVTEFTRLIPEIISMGGVSPEEVKAAAAEFQGADD